VAILGGGLAGLSLAIQLLRERPQTSVVVFEKNTWPAPEAAHKVGESLLQIGASYFERTCGMAEHLAADQLPKMGLRFFLPGGDGGLHERVEIGLADWVDNAPTYQLDRGRFENALAADAARLGAVLCAGTRVSRVTGAGGDHQTPFTISWSDDGTTGDTVARTVVDASGRAGILKHAYGLRQEVPHHCNAAWLRIGRRLKVDDWCSDPQWSARVPQGTRWASTNHLMGAGYWFWAIPLASDSTSFGLVADPDLVPFERMRRIEPLLQWLQEHEPVAARVVEANRDALQDFKVLKHYAHGCERVYSPAGWYVTGEAGVFLDPLYSPGSDAIAVSNTMVTQLITARLDGADVEQTTELFNGVYLMMSGRLLNIWDHQYPLFGTPEVAAMKVAWDFLCYFGSLALICVSGRIADPEFLQVALVHLLRVSELNENMQLHLRDLSERGDLAAGAGYPCMSEQTYRELESTIASSPGHDAAWVAQRLAANVARIEAAAVEIIVRTARPLDPDLDANALDPCSYRLPGSERPAPAPATSTPTHGWRSAAAGLNWASHQEPDAAQSSAYTVWLPDSATDTPIGTRA
jgi:flavin-dependent dehydrogenase